MKRIPLKRDTRRTKSQPSSTPYNPPPPFSKPTSFQRRRNPKKGVGIALLIIIFIIALLLIFSNFSIMGIFDQISYQNAFTSQSTVSSLDQNIISKTSTQKTAQITPIKTTSPSSVKPIISTTRLETRIHDLVNAERNKAGLSSLTFDNCMANTARYHSLDMAERLYFSHYNPEGQGPTDRGKELGCGCPSSKYIGFAENIFQNNLYSRYTLINGIIREYDWNNEEEIAQSTVKGWMTSPGHRQNILTSDYYREGIGIAISNDDKVFITQDFC